MDIKSGKKWPSSSLSNFAPHPFKFRGLDVSSMEGFLQGLKFKNPDMQVHVFTLVGRAAKFAGKKKNWRMTQTLWYQGKEIRRHSKEYQDLLDEAYKELAKNASFKRALLATDKAVITHSIGAGKAAQTVLTRSEFCGRLMRLRDELKKDELKKDGKKTKK